MNISKHQRAKLATIHARNLLREAQALQNHSSQPYNAALEKLMTAVTHIIGAVEDLADAPEGS